MILPLNVNTPAEAVPAVLFSEMVASTDAMPVVPISRTPVAPIAAATRKRPRLSFAAVGYLIAF